MGQGLDGLFLLETFQRGEKALPVAVGQGQHFSDGAGPVGQLHHLAFILAEFARDYGCRHFQDHVLQALYGILRVMPASGFGLRRRADLREFPERLKTGGQLPDRLKTFFRILVEQLEDYLRSFGRHSRTHFGDRRRREVDVPGIDAVQRAGLERILPGKHFVEEHAQRVEVRAHVGRSSLDQLRAHVKRSAQSFPLDGDVAHRDIPCAGDSEIDNHDRAVSVDAHV